MEIKKDFTIETEDLEIEEKNTPPPSPQAKPKEKKKRNFVFTEKRAEALRKGREKRAENLKKQRADLKELEEIRKNKNLDSIKEEEPIKEIITKPKKIYKEKIPDDSEGEAEGISDYEKDFEEEIEEEIVYKKKPKPKPKKKKVKKIIYLSSSEDEEEADYREYKRRLKPSKYSKMIKK